MPQEIVIFTIITDILVLFKNIFLAKLFLSMLHHLTNSILEISKYAETRFTTKKLYQTMEIEQSFCFSNLDLVKHHNIANKWSFNIIWWKLCKKISSKMQMKIIRGSGSCGCEYRLGKSYDHVLSMSVFDKTTMFDLDYNFALVQLCFQCAVVLIYVARS